MGILKNKISARVIVIIIALSITAAIGIGSTIAYLVARTPPVDNTFTPVAVSCQIHENFDTANNVKRDVTVENTGDISAYIRVAIVVNWVSDSGTVYGGGPVAGTDYSISINDADWFICTDGFYYYKMPVDAGNHTTVLINSIAPVEGTEPEGYSLSVNIVASAIQSEPSAAVESAWRHVNVNDDGTISQKPTE